MAVFSTLQFSVWKFRLKIFSLNIFSVKNFGPKILRMKNFDLKIFSVVWKFSVWKCSPWKFSLWKISQKTPKFFRRLKFFQGGLKIFRWLKLKIFRWPPWKSDSEFQISDVVFQMQIWIWIWITTEIQISDLHLRFEFENDIRFAFETPHLKAIETFESYAANFMRIKEISACRFSSCQGLYPLTQGSRD